jgi:hypothetical protein
MRPCIGIVSLRTASRRAGRLAILIELIPLSDRARLIDLVKFKGFVVGSRRSNKHQHRDLNKKISSVLGDFKLLLLTIAKLIQLDFITPCCGVNCSQGPYRTPANNNGLLSLWRSHENDRILVSVEGRHLRESWCRIVTDIPATFG